MAGERDESTGKVVSGHEGDGLNYVTIGGDGLKNCVGTAAVKCHIPYAITVKRQGPSPFISTLAESFSFSRWLDECRERPGGRP